MNQEVYSKILNVEAALSELTTALINDIQSRTKFRSAEGNLIADMEHFINAIQQYKVEV